MFRLLVFGKTVFEFPSLPLHQCFVPFSFCSSFLRATDLTFEETVVHRLSTCIQEKCWIILESSLTGYKKKCSVTVTDSSILTSLVARAPLPPKGVSLIYVLI